MGLVVDGITGSTTVPEAPMKFVHSVGVLVIAINGETGARYSVFSGIVYMLNIVAMKGVYMVRIGSCHHVMDG